ncbi:hypothetical protein ABKN59_008293 [Abortiporus biennis]
MFCSKQTFVRHKVYDKHTEELIYSYPGLLTGASLICPVVSTVHAYSTPLSLVPKFTRLRPVDEFLTL